MNVPSPYPVALHVVNDRMDLPDYMNRPPYSSEELSRVADHGFADAGRRLPIHEKAATFMSACCLYSEPSINRIAEVRLLKAASMHGCLDDVRGVQAALIVHRKEAAAAQAAEPVNQYAFTVEMEDGSLRGYLPLGSESQIQDASHELVKAAALSRLPIDELHKAAARICDEASRQSVPPSTLHPDCVRLAGHQDVDLEKAAHFIEARRHVVPDSDMDVYRQLVKLACEDEGQRDECLSLLVDMDELNGVAYEGAQLDPYRIVFSGQLTKQAFDKWADTMVMIDDVMVPQGVVANLSPQTIDAQFDEQTASLLKQACAKAASDAVGAGDLIAGLDWTEKKVLLTLALKAA